MRKLLTLAIALCMLHMTKIALNLQIPLYQSALIKAAPILVLAFATRHNSLVSLGLVLSAVGDILLEINTQQASDLMFIAGLVSFLIAHLFYCGAFTPKPFSERSQLTNVFFVLISCAFYYLMLHAPSEMQVPVACYVLAIT